MNKFNLVEWVLKDKPNNFETVIAHSCGHSVVCIYSEDKDLFVRIDGSWPIPANLVTAWAKLPQF